MVKCNDCGLLAVRDEYNDQICEATEFTRNRGQHQSSIGNATRAKVLCYARSSSFPAIGELKAASQRTMHDVRDQDIVVSAIATEIECRQFIHWLPGKTPKEHEEMSFVQMIDSRTRQWREEDIRRQQAIEALYEQRHQENRKDLRKISFTVAAIGFVASILASILAAYFTVSK